jgi:hypothetical protein
MLVAIFGYKCEEIYTQFNFRVSLRVMWDQLDTYTE